MISRLILPKAKPRIRQSALATKNCMHDSLITKVLLVTLSYKMICEANPKAQAKTKRSPAWILKPFETDKKNKPRSEIGIATKTKIEGFCLKMKNVAIGTIIN